MAWWPAYRGEDKLICVLLFTSLISLIPRVEYQEVDLSGSYVPRLQSRPSAIRTWKKINEADKELLEGLEKVGYRLDPPGGPGAMWKAYERGGVSFMLSLLFEHGDGLGDLYDRDLSSMLALQSLSYKERSRLNMARLLNSRRLVQEWTMARCYLPI